MLFEKPAPLALAPNDSRSGESGEVRAKALETKAERRARVRAAGERIARNHAEILRALAR